MIRNLPKAVQQHRTPKRSRVGQATSCFRQVLDCAGAPALFGGARFLRWGCLTFPV
jgi:hypothetical protein